MSTRFWGLFSYMIFFPSLYFALVEEKGHPIRKISDPALFGWLWIFVAWIAARFVVWSIWKVFPWEDLAYLPSLTLLVGWIFLTVRGLREFLL